MAGNIELVPTIESGLNVVVNSGLNVIVQSGIQVRPESGAHVIIQSGISVMGTMGVSGQPVALVSGTQVGLSGLQVIIQSGVNIMGSITAVSNISGQMVFVAPISGSWSTLVNTALLADGSEQEMVSNVSGGYYWGYFNLANMALGDSFTFREYVRINGGWALYRSHTYNDVQADPVVGVRVRPIDTGYRFTMQQIAGPARSISFTFQLGARYFT